jgi:hypothetical protein
MTDIVVVNSAYAEAVRRSSGYLSESRTPVRTPHDILNSWFEESKFNMHEKVRGSFREMLAQAKSWKG